MDCENNIGCDQSGNCRVIALMTEFDERIAHLHMGMTRDALAESEARMRDVFEAVNEGVLVAEVSNRQLVMVNPAMCKFLGYSVEALLGMKVSDIHPPEHLERTLEIFAKHGARAVVATARLVTCS